MAQWMKSFRSCNTSITSVGWSAADQPSIPAPKEQASTSKVMKLVEKLTPQKEPSANKKGKTDSDKPEANKRKSTPSRRRNRRKQA
jgi:hypothetical protein